MNRTRVNLRTGGQCPVAYRRVGSRRLAELMILFLMLSLVPVSYAFCQTSSASTSAGASTIGSQERDAIIDTVITLIEKYYTQEDKIAAITGQIKRNRDDGKYNDITDLASFMKQLTDDLRSVSGDKHFGIWPIEESLTLQDESPEEERKWAEQSRFRNFGFGRIERLPGNIGYLELYEFEQPKLAGATAVAAMNYLGNCDALVIDLRRNTGGWGELGTLICSYLFDDPVLLSSVYNRYTNRTEQSWTLPYVPGRRMSKIPVYVLQSHRTFSAAEFVSYSLQALGRATIVGEASGGGAHQVNDFNIPEMSICVTVPIASDKNPVTGTNWEGVGVTPDIRVQCTEALPTACADAVKKLLAKDTTAFDQKALKLALGTYNAELSPMEVSAKKLQRLCGDYRYSASYSYRVFRAGKTLFMASAGACPYTLLPRGVGRFAIKEREGEVRFESNDKGEITGIKITYPDMELVYKRVE